MSLRTYRRTLQQALGSRLISQSRPVPAEQRCGPWAIDLRRLRGIFHLRIVLALAVAMEQNIAGGESLRIASGDSASNAELALHSRLGLGARKPAETMQAIGVVSLPGCGSHFFEMSRFF